MEIYINYIVITGGYIVNMNINLELLKTFYIVARKKSISKAAQDLYISQPAVSKLILNLENIIGIKVFIRTSKGVKLTNFGETLYNYLDDSMSTLLNTSNLIKKVFNDNQNTINIALNSTLCKFYFIPKINNLIELHPKIKINIFNRSTNDSLKSISTGEIDFAIVSPTNSVENYRSHKLLDIHDVFVCGPKFFKFNNITLPLCLSTINSIMLPNNSNSVRSIYDNYFKENNIKFASNIELSTMDLLIELCKNNLGVTIVAKEFILDDLRNNLLLELDTSIPPMEKRSIYLISNPNIPYSKADKLFIDFLINN